ncbi:MAG: alcohol dehydrogenase catalytic domain-containing protein [Eubacteriales bacterium]|nr:alcohol dehydrogenase catalytic domain-containing protein [Eubacteriales bacterium]
MKAAVYEGNHQITIKEGRIVTPKEHQVRLEIAYCGICGSDLHILNGTEDKRMKLPSIIGHECSAIVAETGAGVTNLKKGDHVVVMPVKACGVCRACREGFGHVCANLQVRGIETEGAFQYSWTVDADAVIKIPDSLDLKLAALAEPLSICCHVVKRGGVKAGDYAVIIGGGPIGLMTALVAKSQGARTVISEVNRNRLKKARELGITAVNPIETDIREYVLQATDGSGAEVVFETSGSQAGVETMVLLPKVRGKIVLVAIYGKPMTVDLKQLYCYEKEITTSRMQEKEDFEKAIDLLNRKEFDAYKMITSVLPITEIMQGFQRCADPEGKEVKVMIDCHMNEKPRQETTNIKN